MSFSFTKTREMLNERRTGLLPGFVFSLKAVLKFPFTYVCAWTDVYYQADAAAYSGADLLPLNHST